MMGVQVMGGWLVRLGVYLLLVMHGVRGGASLLGVTSTQPINSREIQQQILTVDAKVADLYDQLGRMKDLLQSVSNAAERQWAAATDLDELDKKIAKQFNNIEEFMQSKPNLANEDFLASSELDIFEKRMVNMIANNEHKLDRFNNSLYNDIDNFNNNINVQLGYILNDILSLRRSFSADLVSNLTLVQETFNSTLSGHDNIINDLMSKISVITELYAVLNDTHVTSMSESAALLSDSINQINTTIDAVNSTVFTVKESLQHDLDDRLNIMSEETVQNMTVMMTQTTSLVQEASSNHDSMVANLTASMQMLNLTYDSMHIACINNITVLQYQVYSNISALTHEVSNNISMLEQTVHGNISTLNQETHDNITALYSVFRSSHTDLSDKVAIEMQDLNSSMSNSLEKYVLHHEQRIMDINNELAALKSSISALNISILQTLDSNNAVIFSNIGALSEKVGQLTTNLDMMNITFHHQMHNTTSYLMDIISSGQEANGIEMLKVYETLQRLSLANSTVYEYVHDVRNQVSVASENIKLVENSYYILNDNYNNMNNNINEMSSKLTDAIAASLTTTHKTIQEYLEGTNSKINNVQLEIQATTTSITKLYTQHAVDTALNEKYRYDYERNIKSLEDHIKVLEEKIGASNININSNDVLIHSMEKRLLAIESELRR